MTPLPPSNTARYKVFYVNQTVTHVVDVRSTPASPSAFGLVMDALFTALGPILALTTVTDVQFAASGSNIFNSVGAGLAGNTYGSGTPTVAGAPEFVSFVGRTSGGRRWRMFIFGINAIAAVDYRFAPGEDANVDNAISVIDGASGIFLGIDGLKPTIYTYANAGVNAYWQKAVRP